MQIALDFTPGLTTRFKSLKQVCAHAVYSSRGGLTGVAAALDMSPSELSKRLSETDSSDNRPLRDSDIEKIIQETGDHSIVHWQVEKYLGDPQAKRDAAMSQLVALAPVFAALAEQAGVSIGKPKR